MFILIRLDKFPDIYRTKNVVVLGLCGRGYVWGRASCKFKIFLLICILVLVYNLSLPQFKLHKKQYYTYAYNYATPTAVYDVLFEFP